MKITPFTIVLAFALGSAVSIGMTGYLMPENEYAALSHAHSSIQQKTSVQPVPDESENLNTSDLDVSLLENNNSAHLKNLLCFTIDQLNTDTRSDYFYENARFEAQGKAANDAYLALCQ